MFVREIVTKAASGTFFDLVTTQVATETRHWKDYLEPEFARSFAGKSNWKYGTFQQFLNRFASEICNAYSDKLPALLDQHFVKTPVRPRFRSGEDALKSCQDWLRRESSSRILLITGDAGAGKSVFTVSSAQDLVDAFRSESGKTPAPFLIRFQKDRPALLPDLIALTLTDLGLEQSLTADSIRFLVEEGRLVLILDGFDEVSRALAHHAEENVDELSRNINKRTSGRLILTARPSFVVQEDIFRDLRASCEQDVHEEYDLAPYTDAQMREWVLRNAPEGALQPPERHWQRIEDAFKKNPAIRELCRTPVFLRMMSEVLVTKTSVSSLFNLLEEFCRRLWERERAKRPLTLSDEQYFYAYEAIALAVDFETRIDSADIRAALEVYFQQYAPSLLEGFPGLDKTLIEDLSIGPLTFKNGRFEFVHEILTAYFLARTMIRRLLAGTDYEKLWNRPVPEAVWQFLPDARIHIAQGKIDFGKSLAERAVNASSGLLAWNLFRAASLPLDSHKGQLFKGKQLAGISFENVDLRDMNFEGANLIDVSFSHSSLAGANFRSAAIRRVKFIDCGQGAITDESLRVADDAEVTVIRHTSMGPETYAGAAILPALRELFGGRRVAATMPPNLAEQAVLVTFGSLYKSDQRYLDYPEWTKVENRLRGWIRTLGIAEDLANRVSRLMLELASEIRDGGWISRNPNRPRTFVPTADRRPIVGEILRLGRVTGVSEDLLAIVRRFDQAVAMAIAELR